MNTLLYLLTPATAAAAMALTATHGATSPAPTRPTPAPHWDAPSKVSVRYMIDDVAAAVDFYTRHLGFAVEQGASPAFASVTRGNLRLLLSGERSSGRRPLPDGTRPTPGGWNRIELPVKDLAAEVARLRGEGVRFRRDDIVSGPGGSQAWVLDPSGNLVELFQARE